MMTCFINFEKELPETPFKHVYISVLKDVLPKIAPLQTTSPQKAAASSETGTIDSFSNLLEHSTKRPKLASKPSDQDLGITLEFAPSQASSSPMSSSMDDKMKINEKTATADSFTFDAETSTESHHVVINSSPPESMDNSPLSASPKKVDKFSLDTHAPQESSKLNDVLLKQPGLGVKANLLMRNLNTENALCKYWFYEGQWFCRIECKIKGQAFLVTSEPDIRKKLLALKCALEKFTGLLQNYSNETKRNDVPNQLFPSSTKMASLNMQDIQRNPPALNAPPTASISTVVSNPLLASPMKPANSVAAEPMKVDKITIPLSRKPILPPSGLDYMMANLPDLTVSSLKKWIQDPRNFGRLNQIRIENQELIRLRTSPTHDPVLVVNAEVLENSSRMLLDDLYAYNASDIGSQMLVYRNCLPISSCKDELLNQIGGNQVVIISGETGMGKSTQVPNYILEQMTINGFGSQCNVIIVVSTVWCGIGLAKRISQERGEVFGKRVGFGFEGEYSPRDKFGSITVCALPEFISKLSRNPDLYGYSHVILDDLEDCKILGDIALFKMRKLLQERLELRLILLTPLIDTLIFAEYFRNFSLSCLPLAPFDMNVSQLFLEDLVSILDSSLLNARDSIDFIRNEMHFGESVRNEEITEVPDMTGSSSVPYSLVEAALGYICSSTPVYEPILIFLPGHEEISTLHRYLLQDDYLKLGYKNPEAYEFISVHETAGTVTFSSIFEKPSSSKRRIILSDQLSECKIAVVEVMHVIDTCRYRASLKEAIASEPFLPYKWVSQMECIRRSRCCGRKSGFGVYYCLMSMSRFGFLAEKPVPEIARIENALSLLDIAEYSNMEKLSDISLNLLHPLPHSLFTSHLNAMIDMGLFTPLSTEMTALGRHLNSLKLPVWLGKLVFNGIFLRCLDPSIIIAAFLICGNPVFKNGLKNATFSFKTECSDHMCLLEVFRMWTDAKASFSRKSEEMMFCDNHNFSHSILTLITKTVNHIRGVVISSGILVSAAELFNRIIGPQKHKEDYLDFFNENCKKQSMIKGLLLTGLYPEFGISRPDSWKVASMIKKEETFDINPNLADWGPMNRIKRYRDATEKLCFGFSSHSDGKLASLASPLGMLLFVSRFNSVGQRDLLTSTQCDISFRNSLFFGYPFEDAEFALKSFKAAFELCSVWFANRTANLPISKPSKVMFTDEEIARVVDNIIRTTVSLLETEEF